MSTKLFFHDVTYYTGSGTYPAGEQSTATANNTVAGANTLRQMDGTLGASQVTVSDTTNPGTTATRWFFRMFASRPLQGNQVVGGRPLNVYVADSESNTNANFWINGVNVYIWRPSTGAKVGTLVDWGGNSQGGAAPTSANSEQTTILTNIATTAVSASDNDIIVCEVWSAFTQSMSSTYTKSFFYNGTTDLSGSAENTAVASAGSVLVLSESVTFKPPSPVQASFRARNDDGSEVTATWQAPANTNWSQSLDTAFRLRFLVTSSVVVPVADAFQLQCSLNGGAYQNVASGSTIVQPTSSINVNDDTPTTQQLGTGTFRSGFVNGALSAQSLPGLVNHTALSGSDSTEVEFILKLLSANVLPNDKVTFRLVDGGTEGEVWTYAVTPQLIAKATGVTRSIVCNTKAVTVAKVATNTQRAVRSVSRATSKSKTTIQVLHKVIAQSRTVSSSTSKVSRLKSLVFSAKTVSVGVGRVGLLRFVKAISKGVSTSRSLALIFRGIKSKGLIASKAQTKLFVQHNLFAKGRTVGSSTSKVSRLKSLVFSAKTVSVGVGRVGLLRFVKAISKGASASRSLALIFRGIKSKGLIASKAQTKLFVQHNLFAKGRTVSSSHTVGATTRAIVVRYKAASVSRSTVSRIKAISGIAKSVTSDKIRLAINRGVLAVGKAVSRFISSIKILRAVKSSGKGFGSSSKTKTVAVTRSIASKAKAAVKAASSLVVIRLKSVSSSASAIGLSRLRIVAFRFAGGKTKGIAGSRTSIRVTRAVRAVAKTIAKAIARATTVRGVLTKAKIFSKSVSLVFRSRPVTTSIKSISSSKNSIRVTRGIAVSSKQISKSSTKLKVTRAVVAKGKSVSVGLMLPAATRTILSRGRSLSVGFVRPTGVNRFFVGKVAAVTTAYASIIVTRSVRGSNKSISDGTIILGKLKLLASVGKAIAVGKVRFGQPVFVQSLFAGISAGVLRRLEFKIIPPSRTVYTAVRGPGSGPRVSIESGGGGHRPLTIRRN